jgi:hypothetical protein
MISEENNILTKFSLGRGLKNEGLTGKAIDPNQPYTDLMRLVDDSQKNKTIKKKEMETNRKIKNVLSKREDFVEEINISKSKIVTDAFEREITMVFQIPPYRPIPNFIRFSANDICQQIADKLNLQINENDFKKIQVATSDVKLQHIFTENSDSLSKLRVSTELYGKCLRIFFIDKQMTSEDVANFNMQQSRPTSIPNDVTLTNEFIVVVQEHSNLKQKAPNSTSGKFDVFEKYIMPLEEGELKLQDYLFYFQKNFPTKEYTVEGISVKEIEIDLRYTKNKTLNPTITNIVPDYGNYVTYYVEGPGEMNVIFNCYATIKLQYLIAAIKRDNNYFSRIYDSIILPEIVGPETDWMIYLANYLVTADDTPVKRLTLLWMQTIETEKLHSYSTWKGFLRLFRLSKSLHNKCREFYNFSIDKLIDVIRSIREFNFFANEFKLKNNGNVISLLKSFYKNYDDIIDKFVSGFNINLNILNGSSSADIYQRIGEFFVNTVNNLNDLIKGRVQIKFDVMRVKSKIEQILTLYSTNEVLEKIKKIKTVLGAQQIKITKKIELIKRKIDTAAMNLNDLPLNENPNNFLGNVFADNEFQDIPDNQENQMNISQNISNIRNNPLDISQNVVNIQNISNLGNDLVLANQELRQNENQSLIVNEIEDQINDNVNQQQAPSDENVEIISTIADTVGIPSTTTRDTIGNELIREGLLYKETRLTSGMTTRNMEKKLIEAHNRPNFEKKYDENEIQIILDRSHREENNVRQMTGQKRAIKTIKKKVRRD